MFMLPLGDGRWIEGVVVVDTLNYMFYPLNDNRYLKPRNFDMFSEYLRNNNLHFKKWKKLLW